MLSTPLDTSSAPQPSPAADIPKPGATFFAPAERLDVAQLNKQLSHLSGHPLLDTLLTTAGGLLAVLNEQRQILALNESLLAYLGIGSADELLGLRLGEALHCPHAHELEGGCGTSRYCSTCGAAIAQAVALRHQKATERLCAIQTERGGSRADLFLRVRATPFTLEDQRLILVLLDDVTRQQQSAFAERIFHHDLNNTLTCLLHASETLRDEARGEHAATANEVHRLVERVVRELELQHQLAAAGLEELHPDVRPMRRSLLVDDLRSLIAHHPSATGKRTTVARTCDEFEFAADPALLLRVLGNMAINALEATHPGGEIRVRVDPHPEHIDFRVWNETPIPPEIALRIFQRNFSTKGTLGRGFGTFSMKLIGERLLGGHGSFESSALDGTTFRFLLPLRPHEA